MSAHRRSFLNGCNHSSGSPLSDQTCWEDRLCFARSKDSLRIRRDGHIAAAQHLQSAHLLPLLVTVEKRIDLWLMSKGLRTVLDKPDFPVSGLRPEFES